MAQKNSFKKFYIWFVGVLVVLVAICLIYVGVVLNQYEASQPESKVLDHFEDMIDAAKDGKLAEMMSKDISSELISATAEKLKAVKGEFTCELIDNAAGGENLTYAVSAGDERLANISLKGTTGETTLLIFPMTEWTITSAVPASYDYKMTLPASMTVTVNGEVATGTNNGNGRITYEISQYLVKPEVTIRDSLGKEIPYDDKTKLDITEYTLQIPSNYTISSADGSVNVSPSTAVCTEIADYKYVSQYIDMPKSATYRLGLFGKDASFVILDNLGNTVDYTLDGHTLKIEGQASSPDIPAEVYSKDDVLAHARTWSLFMTSDLTGANHGYAQVKSFLLPDSYLEDVAWKWATGVDITFTSVHRLDNPPFSEESVSGYIKYSDECFSVDVKLTKMMHLNSGDDVEDTMNCRFYYINKDGWHVADIQEILD